MDHSIAKRSNSWLSATVAAVLLVAGVLKMVSFDEALNSLPSHPPLIPANPLVVSCVEILVGIWIITGVERRLALQIALCLFVAFTVQSAHFLVVGASSCGFVGSVRIPPSFALAVDMVGIVFLIRTLSSTMSRSETIWLRISRVAIGPAILTAAAILAGISLNTLAKWGRFQRLTNAIGLTEFDVIATPSSFSFDVHPDGITFATITFRNLSDRSIRILGARDTVTESLSGDLPVQIDPGSDISITIGMRFIDGPGEFGRKLLFFSDSPITPRIVVRAFGKLRPSLDSDVAVLR